MIGLSASAREAKLRNFRRRVSARGDHYCTLWADRLAWTLLDGRLGNRSRSIIILYHRTPHVLVLLWWAASLSGDDCRTDDSAGDTGDAWTLASFIIARAGALLCPADLDSLPVPVTDGKELQMVAPPTVTVGQCGASNEDSPVRTSLLPLGSGRRRCRHDERIPRYPIKVEGR